MLPLTKIHRGNLKTMSENARNTTTTTTTTTSSGDRNGNKTSAFISNTPQPFATKLAKNEDNHFKRVVGHGKTEDNNITAAAAECDMDSNKGATVAAPTPLPRSSRNNSMTDPSSSSEESLSATGSPRPSPMPRVTIGSGGYKVVESAFSRECFSSSLLSMVSVFF